MKSITKDVAEKFQIPTETLENKKENVHAEVEGGILAEEEAHRYSIIAVEEQRKE